MVRGVHEASVQVNQKDQNNPGQGGMVLVLGFFADVACTPSYYFELRAGCYVVCPHVLLLLGGRWVGSKEHFKLA